MAFTVTFTLETLSQISGIAIGAIATPSLEFGIKSNNGIIQAGMIFHSWLSGFFIGKVSEGNFASGFKYAASLAIIAFITLILSGGLVAGIFGGLF